MDDYVKAYKENAPQYPRVNFNCKSGVLEIEGQSYMENAFKFYEPVILWIQEYMKEKRKMICNIKLSYFNTSSSQFLLDIFRLFHAYQKEGGDVTVYWYYPDDDPDLPEEIDDFMAEAKITIITIPEKEENTET